MNNIQWYPGHMAKAVRMMEENFKLCDAAVCVLDARAPASSYNPRLVSLAAGKPVLYVFNKGDLADGGADLLLARVRQSGKRALKICAVSSGAARQLQAAMEELTAEIAARRSARGSSKPIRFLVAGVPNTGKSAVINALAGEKKAATGDKAGVTRGKQWVKCGAFELLDTPGVMPPAFEDQARARRLAYLGSINDDVLALDELALALLSEMEEKYPAALAARYGIEGGSPLGMLESVCARRGFLLRGGEFDYERGERALLDDLRKGKLGKICLDGVQDLREAGLI